MAQRLDRSPKGVQAGNSTMRLRVVVPVVDVGRVLMRVFKPLMLVHMRVPHRGVEPGMRVIMVAIEVVVHVLVLDGLVDMGMRVLVGQREPGTGSHGCQRREEQRVGVGAECEIGRAHV